MKRIEKSGHNWSAADLGTFYSQYRSEFLAHANRILKDSAKAEEIVQDALVRVMLASPELASEPHAVSYFHRTIENLCMDVFRLEGRRPNLVLLDDAAIEIESQWIGQEDHADLISAADDAAIIREAISLLSPAERAALVMWEMEGRSTSEIAAELGVKESTVRHTVARARTSLRRILSERIIDEERGLTALDLLSTTYRKAATVAKKSSRVALSLLLVVTAFLGFNSLSGNEATITNEEVIASGESKSEGLNPEDSLSAGDSFASDQVDPETLVPKSEEVTTQGSRAEVRSFAIAPVNANFPGLDSDGVPTGFTITDSSGSLGKLFVTKRGPTVTETGLNLATLVSTHSGAVNLLMDQAVIVDGFGTSYTSEVSVGINGGWQPLELASISTDIERLASGNYLLTAIMMVDSAVEATIRVSTGTSGTDLSSAPYSIITKVLLSPTKTQILGQAVLVSENTQVGRA